MSYSIRDALRDDEENSRVHAAIAKAYPEARVGQLPDGRDVWISVGVEATDIAMIATRAYIDQRTHAIESDGVVYLCGFTEVEGKSVFTEPARWVHGINFCHDMKKRHPELHAALLKIVRASPPGFGPM